MRRLNLKARGLQVLRPSRPGFNGREAKLEPGLQDSDCMPLACHSGRRLSEEVATGRVACAVSLAAVTGDHTAPSDPDLTLARSLYKIT